MGFSTRRLKEEVFIEFWWDFFNGAFHWVTSEHPERIVALDLAKETYAELLLPEYYSISHDDYRDFRLAPLGESLCLIYDSWGTHTNLDMWVMIVYGAEETWVKFASFQFATHGWIDESLVPLFCSNDEKLLFQCQMGFIIYDPKHSLVLRINYFIFGKASIVA
ncbi:F-box associated domain containing protein [Tanacetum coccineum]